MKLTKEKQLINLMKEYNASDLDDLMDILPDLEVELPQQEEIDLSEYFLNYKEPVLMDASCPFSI